MSRGALGAAISRRTAAVVRRPFRNTPPVSATVGGVVDRQGKIARNHGPGPNLDLDAKTMAFPAHDVGMLKALRTGDIVRFGPERAALQKRLEDPMKRIAILVVTATALATGLLAQTLRAQPAAGARGAFERVVEVMGSRFRDVKLTGDPDRDFATILVAHHEDLIFLARTQLEYGADRQLRQLAQRMLEDQQRQIDEVKQWQVRARQGDHMAQAGQPPSGSGPLTPSTGAAPAQMTQSAPPPAAQAAPAPAAPATPADLPLVNGRIEKIDAAQGKVTIDHGPIPNLNMDSMTMVFRTQNPAILKGVKTGDRVRFTADRVNGQISVIKIQKGR